MALSIKDPETDELARELEADRRARAAEVIVEGEDFAETDVAAALEP